MLRLTIQHRPTNSGAQYLSLLQTTSTQPMNLPAHFQPPTKFSLRLHSHRATTTATAALPQHQHATINARSRAFVATQPTAYTLLNEKSKKVKSKINRRRAVPLFSVVRRRRSNKFHRSRAFNHSTLQTNQPPSHHSCTCFTIHSRLSAPPSPAVVTNSCATIRNLASSVGRFMWNG